MALTDALQDTCPDTEVMKIRKTYERTTRRLLVRIRVDQLTHSFSGSFDVHFARNITINSDPARWF